MAFLQEVDTTVVVIESRFCSVCVRYFDAPPSSAAFIVRLPKALVRPERAGSVGAVLIWSYEMLPGVSRAEGVH